MSLTELMEALHMELGHKLLERIRDPKLRQLTSMSLDSS